MLLGSPVHVESCQNPTVTRRPPELLIALGVLGVTPVAGPFPPQAAAVNSTMLNDHRANSPLDHIARLILPKVTIRCLAPDDGIELNGRHVQLLLVRLTPRLQQRRFIVSLATVDCKPCETALRRWWHRFLIPSSLRPRLP